MAAYDQYLAGDLVDYSPDDKLITKYLDDVATLNQNL